MTVALCATAIVVLALLWEVSMPWLDRKLDERRHRRERPDGTHGYDPGRERRAEQRARELLRSCVNEEEWGMYSDLGFLRVCCLLYTSPSPRDRTRSRMPSSA